MTARRFRFRPPALATPPELPWILRTAFAEKPEDSAAPAAALELARRLGLLPRIAARAAAIATTLRSADPDTESAPAVELARERALALALELRFAETLAAVAAAAAAIGAELAPLKGRALAVSGRAAAGARPCADLDLLVAPASLAPLHAELRRGGFEVIGGAYEHQLPALRHPRGEVVELHRHLPGVRLDGRRSATFGDLAASGLLDPGGPDGVRVPCRDVLVAHALVHALAQHGLAARYPGWLLIGDLLDLGATAATDGAAGWRAWIARDVAAAEIDAALALAARCARGEDPFAPSAGDAALLARHWLAAALDPGYAEALKTRWLEAPVTDHGRWRARARALFGVFVPPAGATAPNASARALGWLARPFVLARKALGAARAARRALRASPRSP
jgi:hypothetical protein